MKDFFYIFILIKVIFFSQKIYVYIVLDGKWFFKKFVSFCD